MYALDDDFQKLGLKAIEAVRKTDPSTYLKVVASLLPKEIEAEITPNFVIQAPMPIESIEEWAGLNGSSETIIQ